MKDNTIIVIVIIIAVVLVIGFYFMTRVPENQVQQPKDINQAFTEQGIGLIGFFSNLFGKKNANNTQTNNDNLYTDDGQFDWDNAFNK